MHVVRALNTSHQREHRPVLERSGSPSLVSARRVAQRAPALQFLAHAQAKAEILDRFSAQLVRGSVGCAYWVPQADAPSCRHRSAAQRLRARPNRALARPARASRMHAHMQPRESPSTRARSDTRRRGPVHKRTAPRCLSSYKNLANSLFCTFFMTFCRS